MLFTILFLYALFPCRPVVMLRDAAAAAVAFSFLVTYSGNCWHNPDDADCCSLSCERCGSWTRCPGFHYFLSLVVTNSIYA